MNIAIIAGSGDFPIYIAKQNINAFVLCIDEHSNSKNFVNISSNVSLLDPDSWISTLKKNKITHVVMAGKINRPKIIKENLKKNAAEFIKKINYLGDNDALNLIQFFFNSNGFEILPVSSILKNCFFPKGFHSENKISSAFYDYIIRSAEIGINLLDVISQFDVGQSVIVCSKLVYAIEAQEGTDAMIDRVGTLDVKPKQPLDFGPVLIKIPKKKQNFNLDLPVIGLNTIKKCIKFGFSSIVVSSSGTLIIDLKSTISFVKKNNFCIYSI